MNYLDKSKNELVKELQESEERFKVITSSTPDHILVQDNDLRYTLVINPQLGLSELDRMGKCLNQAMHISHRMTFKCNRCVTNRDAGRGSQNRSSRPGSYSRKNR
ncbi:MAG: hypothetical protein D4R64_00560 [Porphyromonadaceae bacterium]|nr:MAG: hypothetical protein D4R64_00560 [Porphyromonadaceae bacterium]